MNVLSGWTFLLISASYMGLLFIIARLGERRADQGKSLINGSVYALSLAVYCTTWTFFGSVGRATSDGYSFLAIYLGPTLLMLFAGVLLKMIRISKTLKLTSIADFLSTRYGKSPWVAGVVTLIAVIGVVPYIALQLKAISTSLIILLKPEQSDILVTQLPWFSTHTEWWSDTTFWIAAVLALFTILFGTRHLDASERHEGMVLAIAFESVVKLFAFLMVGIFVTFYMFDGFEDLWRRAATSPDTDWIYRITNFSKQGNGSPAFNWLALILLSGFAALFLPRQFQVMVVENVNESHVRTAVWMFPLYMLLINLFVVPIAIGGTLYFQGQYANADAYVLTLPLAHDNVWLALLVFLGGLSAATAMIIVECIALSTMICNDLVMPLLLRLPIGLQQRKDVSRLIFTIRRLSIIAILMLGYVYFRVAGDAYALVDIGLISFTAVAQFAPALFGALYWRLGNEKGALAGLIGGFIVWLYTLLLPSFAQSGWINGGFVEFGPWGIEILRAQALFGLKGWNSTTHCLFWSLLINTALYTSVSLFSRQSISETALSRQFVDIFRIRHHEALGYGVTWRGHAKFGELYTLMLRFLGSTRTKRALRQFVKSRGLNINLTPMEINSINVDASWVHFAESHLSGAIGSASARVMISSVLQEESLHLEDVLGILDEASQIRAYSHDLELKSRELERASQELRNANMRLREVDRMKDDFIATVSHELRTPLTSIRAFGELLQTTPDINSHDQHRFLNIIINETDRLTRLINQVLDMAKLESGRMTFEMSECLIIEIVREAVNSMQAVITEQNLHVTCWWGNTPPLELIALTTNDDDPWLSRKQPIVMADHDHLIQVLQNLLANAIKFSPQGSALSIHLKITEDVQGSPQLQVSIEDEGQGIPMNDLELIFNKFHQSQSKITGKPRGTGLGLTISRQLIESMNGKIWAENRDPSGARFCFCLPLITH